MEPATHSKDTPTDPGYPPLVLRLRPVLELTQDQFLELSSLNHDLHLELTAEGELVVMPPAGGESSNVNAGITAQLWIWAKRDGTGAAFDSSGGFVLPNGAVRSPDSSWVRRSRLETLTTEQRRRFLPLCPDFVMELRPSSDRLSIVQDKMKEYMDNGARLGWLIDPEQKRVYVYRPQRPVREQDAPETVSGDPVLPGFVLNLREVW
ncbi:MAG: hypothetical protein QOI57_1834 [Rubrobacteraceae bacterium]|nr:hypothetical protein [Rubrobacteraceae bacterium]